MPFVTLTVFILNFVKKSLQLELYNFADFLKTPSVTKQAFSKARNKLSPLVYVLLNQKIQEEFYTDNDIKTFKGLKVFGVDGSTLRLPKSSEVYDTYGRDKINGSTVPLARISVIYDVLNHITLHGTIRPYSASEHDDAIEHINHLTSKNSLIGDYKNLLIFDRGYPSLCLLYKLNQAKEHFIMRISHVFLGETNQLIKSGALDSIITISTKDKWIRRCFKKHVFKPKRKQPVTMEVRCLTFTLSSGLKEYILTSLTDKDLYSYDEIFKLYGMRWNVEEAYKFYKNVAQIENFSGKSKIAIEQEFYATILACNMSAIIMLEAQEEIELAQADKSLKWEYKVNRNMLMGILKNEIVDVLLSGKDLNEYCEKLKIRIKKNLVPIRPGRKFPRNSKRVRDAIDRRAL